MGLDFVKKVISIGGATTEPTLRFYRKGFNLGGSGSTPWQDIILDGNGSLTLANAKADGLNYLKLFGECEQPATQRKIGVAYVIDNTTGVATDEFTGGIINANLSLLRSGNITSPATPSGIIADVDFTKAFILNRENVIFTATPNETIDICSIHTNTIPTGIAKWVYDNGVIKAYCNYNNAEEYTVVSNIVLNQPYSFRITYNYNSALSKWRVFLSIKEPNSEYYIAWIIHDVTLTNDANGYANVLVGNGTGFSSNIDNVTFTNDNVLKFAVTEVSTPTPDTPLDIVCNNGVIKVNSQGQIYTDGTVETVEVDTTGDTATAEMLLAVGSYQDVQSVLDGSVTRNVGVKVLNGTEDWIKQDTRFVYQDNSTDRLASVFGGYCDKFTVKEFNVYETDICIMWLTNGIHIVSSQATVEDFKAWLSANPIIMVYAKSLPTTETVTAQPLTIQAGTNIVEITQASIDNLPLEVSYKGTV